MGRRKISTTVYFEPEQLEMLEKLAKALRKPVAELVRDGIDMVLEREKDILKMPNRPVDVCIWCSYDFGLLALNKEGRPVRCYPDCEPLARTGWQAADRSIDVGRVMTLAQKRMDDLSCRPPEPKSRTRL